MTETAKVDVILPTYNRREFLPRAIGCVRNQTFGNWRLLVVNDGGEDVADVIGGFHDPRILYFNRPHAGKAAQLNYALGQVTADYVAYMDDDDDVFPEHLEKLLSAVERVGADFVYSDTYLTILDADGRVRRRTVENTEDATPENIRLYNKINHKQVLHTKELADRMGGYDESMRILIDFDGIKRLFGAARRPFHLREITGEHFLRMNAATGTVSSISGLWKRDPAAAGRSLLAFFAKDPAALAALYRSVPVQDEELDALRRKADRRLSARWRKLFHPALPAGAVHDALPPVVTWRDMTPADGLAGFFRFADETDPTIAAVNRIAVGTGSEEDRRVMCAAGRFPLKSAAPRFGRKTVRDGWRFVHPAGAPMRWVMLSTASALPPEFALEFDYLPHAEFKEQLQFDFRMASLGDRLRFMVRGNSTLVMNAVENGRFPPDLRSTACSFPVGRISRVRIESCRGVHSFFVDGRNLLSLAYDGPVGKAGGYAAFVFYDSDPSKPIDFEISRFRFFVPQ